MAGLIGLGQTYRQQATALASQSDELKFRREQENQMMENAKKQRQAGLVATGAVVGAEAGSGAGPWGAIIGAGIGFLAGELF